MVGRIRARWPAGRVAASVPRANGRKTAGVLAESRASAAGRVVRPQPRSWGRDFLTAVLSAWLIAGVFLDAWAHNTRPDLETFFTPWHAVLYSGFLATGGWIAWTVGRARRRAGSWTALPSGYALGGYGVILFAVAGLGDMIWHVVFGVERELAALLSPTHLGLFGALERVAHLDRPDADRRHAGDVGEWSSLADRPCGGRARSRSGIGRATRHMSRREGVHSDPRTSGSAHPT